jgi:hypothetical protein
VVVEEPDACQVDHEVVRCGGDLLLTVSLSDYGRDVLVEDVAAP